MRIAVLGAAAALVCAPGAWSAQKPAAYHPTHNVYGQPDFEGVWSFNSLTRLERPRTVPGLVLSEADAKRITPAQVLPNDSVGTSDTEAHDEFNYTWARLGGEIRSSWLIEPADGRLPYRPEGEAKLRAAGGSDNPEGRSTYERCISMPQGGPPMLNAATTTI
ncbi:hypothetical protein BH11PSE2_BH11PSE2_07860 [soil metagenome]